MAAVRHATATWTGDLTGGSGEVDAKSSGAFGGLPVTWASRTETADGRTSPEELLAAAHATCFSMAFSGDLARAGFTPKSVTVSAEVTFDRVDGKWTVVSSKLTVHGQAEGLDQAQFAAIAEGAKDGCPISRALQGNVSLSVAATLDM
jgi:osmotically inducible protein OsmC